MATNAVGINEGPDLGFRQLWMSPTRDERRRWPDRHLPRRGWQTARRRQDCLRRRARRPEPAEALIWCSDNSRDQIVVFLRSFAASEPESLSRAAPGGFLGSYPTAAEGRVSMIELRAAAKAIRAASRGLWMSWLTKKPPLSRVSPIANTD